MKIISINIPADSSKGLKDINMTRLGNIVLIAGKNGSGKTRILDKISRTLMNKPSQSQYYDNYQKNIRQEKYMQMINKKREIELAYIDPNYADQDEIQKQLQTISSEIDAIRESDLYKMQKLKWDLIITDTLSNNYNILNFAPKSLILTDCNTFNKTALRNNAEMVDTIGVKNLPNGTFAKIQYLQNLWVEVTHQNLKIHSDKKEAIIKNYETLQQLIEKILNTKIGRNNEGDATLFDLPLGKSKLSDGQKILLQFCVAIHSQKYSLEDIIIALDEPENHLHPSVAIEIIERIFECVNNGQLWIITHSVPLLAHFSLNKDSSLWYVDDGAITYAGRTPENVLNSLLGDEIEKAKFQDFINLPAQFSTNKFAFECLLQPISIMTDKNDPQTKQINNKLVEITTNNSVRILDYGAGKGRLISNLIDLDKESKDNLLPKIDYIAYDENDIDNEICKESITRIFSSWKNRYYNDFKSLFSTYDKKSFDIVVMCNVLHEIDPLGWIKLFKENGEITTCLKSNGILLLVEDYQMPVGEMAYQKGFLVLDTYCLKALFSITESDINFKYFPEDTNARFKAHQIPKGILERITAESRIDAIQAISDTAKEKIKEIRAKSKNNYKDGLIHGFWTQQLANAELSLAELGKK